MSDPSDQLPPGTIIHGRYRIRQVLGSGAMGRVYEALDLTLGRKLAIKILSRNYGDEKLVERLFREAQAAARADHPGVVIPYGSGIDKDSGLSYLAMERFKGEDLGKRIVREGPQPIEFVLRLGREVAHTLAAVHEADVIHRDLKPSNIFLAESGLRKDEIKLLDFGIAKLLDLSTITTAGHNLGTPMYMAPELLRSADALDFRCDLYSLGVVLYECATGKRPYPATNLTELIIQLMSGPEPDVRAARRDLPERLAQVITRCLQRNPSARFQTALSLYEALARP